MRKIFSEQIQKLALEDESIVFLTGDLGYGALENLRDVMKDRFINAGVAEQNMIGVAAGMAHRGYKVFCYSIAPFIVYRCLEQTRNDVCLHNLPVFLVGNGGGYGYGIMGSSHHALEDIGCLSGLQNMTCHVPAFAEDVEVIMRRMLAEKKPAYLRLGLGKKAPENQTLLENFNWVIKSDSPKATVIAMGPIVNNVIDSIIKNNFAGMIDVFTVTQFPILKIDAEILKSVQKSGKLLIIEEHVAQGGCAQQFITEYARNNKTPDSFSTLYAKGYPGKIYGDQSFHQKISGIDSESISTILNNWLN